MAESSSSLVSTAGFEVDGSDVVKLVLQFLHEQGLPRAARELQAESGVALNTVVRKPDMFFGSPARPSSPVKPICAAQVDNREHFSSDLRHGRWESVLPQVQD